MIDPIQVPILLKAIDFVFEEGRKILQERREKRKLDNEPPRTETQDSVVELSPVEAKDVKQNLISTKIDEILWQKHEEDLQHLVKLLETYSKNYHLAKEQYAKWGSTLVPPIIVHNMTEAENSMIATIDQLEIILSKVYKKQINNKQN